MAAPTRRQFTTSSQTVPTSAVNTYVFGSACVAGNLIVVTLAGDKNTGTISVTDNIGTGSGANPWVVEASIPGASVSLYVARKVARGGETTVTVTTSSVDFPDTGNTGYGEEMQQAGAGPWTATAKAIPVYNDTARSAASSGTSDVAEFVSRALAVGTVDSHNTVTGTPSFSNSYTKINTPVNPADTGGGNAACYVGTLDLAAGATTSTTFSTNGGSDQLTCAIVAFGRAGNPPTVSAGADASIDQYEPFTRTATVDDGGAAITSQAWTVVSGPNQVGATLSTTAAIAWAPTVGGTYVLGFTATNSIGTSQRDDVTVTVLELNFPVTAPLSLVASLVGSKRVGSARSAPMTLVASRAGGKSGALAPIAPLQLTATIVGQRINRVTAPLRLFAALESAGGSNGAFVTAAMQLGASVGSTSRTGSGATSAPLQLAASAEARSSRAGQVGAALRLAATQTGHKTGIVAPSALLALSAWVADQRHDGTAGVTGALALGASVSGRSRASGPISLLANLLLRAETATASDRSPQVVAAPMVLRAVVFAERIVAEVLAVRPRADTTVKYDLVCVARVPQVSGPPTFLEVDSIEWTGLTHTEALSEAPSLSSTVKIDKLTESVLQRLQTPHELPSELWLYRNGKQVFSGPLLGGRVSGESISLEAQGVLSYLRGWHVVADMTFTNVDQFAIVVALINQWQSLEYGHFGIDTSGVSESGVLRTVSYPFAELHKVAERIDDLTKMADGFDLSIDPASRMLELYHPIRGVDRSTGADAIIFDGRNVTSSDITFSIGPGDLASEGLATGTTSGSDTPLVSTFANAELRARYGRMGVTGNFEAATQGALDAAIQAQVEARAQTLLIPGPNARVTLDSDLGSYDVGDVIGYHAHSRLAVSGAFRIRKRSVSVAETGTESVSVEFV